jgi:hypothetical protein
MVARSAPVLAVFVACLAPFACTSGGAGSAAGGGGGTAGGGGVGGGSAGQEAGAAPDGNHDTAPTPDGNQDAAPTPGGNLVCAGSAETACSGQPCGFAWSAVLTKTMYCSSPTGADQYQIAECGHYHVLRHIWDSGTAYTYYDSVSGKFVAEVVVLPTAAVDVSCSVAGPAGGFAMPDCSSTAFHAAPAWCVGDAGTDGSD